MASLLTVGTGAFLLHDLAEEEAQPYSVETEASGSGVAESASVETKASSSEMTEAETEEETDMETEGLEEQDKTEEEIYYEYLNQVLIPEYGLANLHQEGTMTMDYSNPASRSSQENQWFEPKGIVSAYIDDLDLDGEKELFVIYWEKEAAEGAYGGFYEMTGAIYEVQENQAVCKDKMRLSTSEYDWEKNRESMGNFCVAMMEAEGRKYLLVYKNHLVGEHFLMAPQTWPCGLQNIKRNEWRCCRKRVFLRLRMILAMSLMWESLMKEEKSRRNCCMLAGRSRKKGLIQRLRKHFLHSFRERGWMSARLWSILRILGMKIWES